MSTAVNLSPWSLTTVMVVIRLTVVTNITPMTAIEQALSPPPPPPPPPLGAGVGVGAVAALRTRHEKKRQETER